ncbi:MAG: hypothetical protein ABII64_09865 [Elusimicrobiota bacterium]
MASKIRTTKPRGVSLVETMIAVAIISTAFLAVINVFGTITKSIQVSKTKTLAANLAQEKLQILRQVSYLRLLVTPVPYYRTDFTPSIPYDTLYYPPETIYEGSVAFTRLTYVQMAAEVGTDLVYMGSTPDTGMKMITCTVIWSQNEQPRMLQLRTIYTNPNTIRTNAEFAGVVLTTSGAPIPDASVVIAENMTWQDLTTSTGSYNISCYDGTYTLLASKRGYFDKSVFRSIGPYQTAVQDFALTAMSSGTVRGYAWINDHIVISNIVTSSVTVEGFDQEFIEFYNPTTSYFLTTGGNYELIYQESGCPEVQIMADFVVPGTSVAPNSFLLIANTETLHMCGTTKSADAVYTGGMYGASVIKSPNSGGVGLREVDWATGTRIWVDRVGWVQNPGMGVLYPDIREGQALSWDTNGFEEGEQYVRMTAAASLTPGYGRAYDNDNNNYCFFQWPYNSNYPPCNKYDSSSKMVAATPALGAVVSCDDGLSLPVTAITKGGSYPYAEYWLPEVATGTWRVMITSDTARGPRAMEISTVTIYSHGQILSIPNALTTPKWPSVNVYSIFLTSEPACGFVTGKVLNALGIPINPAVIVFASNGSKINADVNTGRYILPSASGTWNVTANPTYDVEYNPLYVTQVEDSVNVYYGQVTSNIDFYLSQGGRVSGNVTRDGINPLPSVSIAAFGSSGASMGDTISAIDGKFTIINLATGTYTVQPILDSGEKSFPTTLNALVTAGSNVFVGTFTIIGAFGAITGSVSRGGDPISTGVLLVASTETFTGPPTLTSFTATGCAYYFTNSYEDGTYRLEVRGSTNTTYNVRAYVPNIQDLVTTTDILLRSGISILPGGTVTGQDFAW